MKKCLQLVLVAAVAVLAGAGQASELAQQPVSPATAAGTIDGFVALGLWPVFAPDETAPRDPSGFKVHLVPVAFHTSEQVEPAGEWFLPDAAGVYRYFLEGAGMISPEHGVLGFGLARGEVGMRMLAFVAPAGTVVLRPGTRVLPSQSLLLYSTASRFVRRVAAGDASRPVQMPPGPVLALLRDDSSGQLVAMGRPAAAAVERPGTIDPRAPTPPLSDLLVRVRLDGALLDKGAQGVSATLQAGATTTPAHLVFFDASNVYAAWWGLEGRRGTATVQAPGVQPAEVEVLLPPGALRTAEAVTAPGARLHVALRLPEGFPTDRMVVHVLKATQPLGSQRVEDPASPAVFENLPALPLTVVLEAGPWKVAQGADLRGGGEQTVVIEPPVIRVTGRVTQCEDGVGATVGFLGDSADFEFADTETDADGHYAALLFKPVALARVRLLGAAEFLEPMERGITRDTVHDIELPCNAFCVRVTDRDSARPIAGARIRALNRAESAPGSTVETRTDAEGMARLNPQRPGWLTVTAEADGYESASRKEQVLASDKGRELAIALEPSRPGARLVLALADGRPAAGAQVSGATADGTRIVWESTCDAGGRAGLPDSPSIGLLLARHPEAGLLVEPWPTSREGSARVTMPMAGPLRRLLARTAEGRPASWSAVAVWVGGIRLSDDALSWAAQSSALCGMGGEFVLKAGPLEGVSVVCWTRASDQRFRAGALDGLKSGWDTLEILRITAY